MGSVNRVLLLGNLGRDPELRFSPQGTPVANLSLATNRRWKDRESGEPREATDWHRIVVWGKQAQAVSDHLKKGSPVHVEGRLQTREWTDKEGTKRWTTEVVALRVQFVGKQEAAADAPAAAEEPPVGEPEPDDDIPF